MKWQKGKPKTGGRVPGVPNRATQDIKAIAKGLIEDPEYQARLKARLLKGCSPTLEVLLHYYAYGKPKTEIVSDRQVTVIVQRGGTSTVINPEPSLEGPRVIVDRAGRGASPTVLNADPALLTHEEETDD